MNTHEPTSPLAKKVVSIAHRARTLRIVTEVTRVAAVVLVTTALCSALDALIRFPWVLRVAMLIAFLLLCVFELRRHVFPALRFRPTPVDIALRIERMRPEFTGRLASAVEFDLSGQSDSNTLAFRAVEDASERSRGTELGKVLRYGPALTRSLWLVALVGGAAFFTAHHPAAATIALRRVFTPWSDAAWPSRSSVESLVVDGTVAARGRPFALRARLTTGDPTKERVSAEFRYTHDGVAGDWQEVILSQQPSGDFERLVDADGDSIELRFLTSDATTQFAKVRLVTPPSLVGSQIRITPPTYATRVVAERVEVLGDGRDGQSVVKDPVLAGSTVTFEFRISREVPFDVGHSTIQVSEDRQTGLETQIESQPETQDVGATTGAPTQAQSELGTIDGDVTHRVVSFVARHSTHIAVHLVDADGIEQESPAEFSFQTNEDRAPTAAIIEPAQDESVVSDAKVLTRTQSRDDLELRAAGLEIATRIGKTGAESLVFESPATVAAGASSADLDSTLDVSKLKLEPGDSIALRGFGDDFFEDPAMTPSTHPRSKSAVRVLRIVGEEEFERQIRASLAGVRREAMRLDERQAKARDAAEQDAVAPDQQEAQGAITEGIARARESVAATTQRLTQNRRETGVLAETVRQATDLIDAARTRSVQASAALEEAARAHKQQDPNAQAEATREAMQRQDEVREELEDLVGILDRDEDAWVARRRIDALANRVRQLARETDQAAQRSSGETREELSTEAKEELDALGERQEQAAKEAEKLATELRERSKSLAQADPKQAKALDAAAKAVEEGRVREELEEAANDAKENRLEQSKDRQSRASAALAKAAQALAEDNKVRAEELARALESMVDSVKRLLEEAQALAVDVRDVSDGTDAEAELLREAVALPVGKLSQNARGVASDARGASREAARAARAVDAAASSLAAATGYLRAQQFNRNDASAAMDAAIKSLETALSEAEEAADRAQERAQEEKREELLVKYRSALERQVVVRASVSKIVPPAQNQLARRELMESRRLSVVQEELRLAIDAIRVSEEDVQGSDALIEMHDVIDGALIDARTNLSDGDPTSAVLPEDEAIDALTAIVAALDESDAPEDKDKFGEQEAEQGEGGGGGSNPPAGAVPPVAEVKILRAMQNSLAKRTRALADESAALDLTTRAQRVAELAAKQQRILELGARISEKLSPSGRPTIVPADPAGATEPKSNDEPSPDDQSGEAPTPSPQGGRAQKADIGERRSAWAFQQLLVKAVRPDMHDSRRGNCRRKAMV